MVSTINDILSIKQPTETELLVVVFDLTNFTKFARTSSSSQVFLKMKEFNELTSSFVQKNGGLIIKFLGDAGLCVFQVSTSIGFIVLPSLGTNVLSATEQCQKQVGFFFVRLWGFH
ncbi:MAG: hypothetical protein JNM39_13495 [Bdellovibrionaceae bacterium]|nr:hypothetical protein [Pseudobdellovibrionaceae bacterium]